ncbi:hypothetical protein GC174_13105 [bacterium]|nr:hypothetical protein [bacterium]
MSNSSKVPTIISNSLVLLTIAGFAWIFIQLPQDWYRPTELATLLGSARMMILVANFYIVLLPIIFILAVAALLMRPKTWSWNLLILLLPLIPAEAAHFWGAYCWINKELVSGAINSWTFSTFQNLTNLAVLRLRYHDISYRSARLERRAPVRDTCAGERGINLLRNRILCSYGIIRQLAVMR